MADSGIRMKCRWPMSQSISISLIDDVLFSGGSHWVRLWAPIATERHLSLFATGAVAHYTKEGLFQEFGVVSTRVAKPVAGVKELSAGQSGAGASCREG